MTPRERLIIPVAIVTALGWLAALTSGLLTENFLGLEITTPTMMLLAGYTFGVQIVKGTSQ